MRNQQQCSIGVSQHSISFTINTLAMTEERLKEQHIILSLFFQFIKINLLFLAQN